MKPQPSLKKSPVKAPAERVLKEIQRQTRRGSHTLRLSALYERRTPREIL